MSDNSNPQSPSEGASAPAKHLSIEEILKDAQAKMTIITEFVETAKSASIAATESQRLIAAALTDAQTKLTDIASATTQAVAAKTKITDDQAVIATKSDHIQKAQEHADTVRGNLDRVFTAATQQATAVEGQNLRAQTAADSAATFLLDIQKRKGSVESDAAAIVSARKTAEDSTTRIKGLADKSAQVETCIAEYEKRLAELESQCAIQLKTITDLLPGATSAGLAHAFDDRRETFLKPHNRWQWLFVGSLLAIIGLTISGFWVLYHSGANGAATTPSYDEVLRMWLSRLPVVGALVWLALHASREAALAKRLEEDYGYKAAIAASFLGFHKQMAEIGSAAGANKPLAKLCEDTLTTIACPPGRIYENHKLTITPADEITDAAKAAANLANAAKSPLK
jgi:hypothetical protein